MTFVSFGMASKRRRLIGSALVTDEREWGELVTDEREWGDSGVMTHGLQIRASG